jgi:IS4 transposase
MKSRTYVSSCRTRVYKNRLQVELFFKWIKQHLRIRKFLGTSENAVKTHIWCAVTTYQMCLSFR